MKPHAGFFCFLITRLNIPTQKQSAIIMQTADNGLQSALCFRPMQRSPPATDEPARRRRAVPNVRLTRACAIRVGEGREHDRSRGLNSSYIRHCRGRCLRCRPAAPYSQLLIPSIGQTFHGAVWRSVRGARSATRGGGAESREVIRWRRREEVVLTAECPEAVGRGAPFCDVIHRQASAEGRAGHHAPARASWCWCADEGAARGRPELTQHQS